MNNLSPRDRRALALLGAAVVITALVYFWPAPGSEVVAPAQSSVPAAERRLEQLRARVATLPGKQKLADGVLAQLKEREKGLVEAETAPQAQAQLSQLLRKVMRAQSPPMEVGQVEIGGIQPLGKDYGEALISVATICRIEQLVNLLADLSRQPETIATRELRVLAADPRQKTISVRLTVSAVLPKRLVPAIERRPAFF